MTPPKLRARSRLNQKNLQAAGFERNRTKQKAKLPVAQKLAPLLYLATGGVLSSYILFFVQPASIKNIPVPDSYGPLLFSLSLALYGLCKFLLKSRIISLVLMFVILGLISLKLQNFHDIL